MGLVHQFEQNTFKKSPLEVAIMNSNFDWIKDMLEKLGIQPDAECETEVAADAEQENMTENNRAGTLQLAIAWGNVEIVRLLVEYGAKLDGINNVDALDGEIKTI